MNRFKRQALYSWAFIGTLTALSVLLAVLQYRWIGEVSRAEQDRLKAGLHTALERLRGEFNGNISQATSALMLSGGEISGNDADRDQAYLEKFKNWRDTGRQERLFASITRIIPVAEPNKEATVILRLLDQHQMSFRPIEWPANWSALHEEILRQVSSDDDGPRRPPSMGEFDSILFPVFPDRPGEPPGPRSRTPLEWIVFEVDLNYVRSVLMPELMDRLTRAVGPGFDAEVVSRNDASVVIFQSDPEHPERIGAAADAQVGLFDIQPRPQRRPMRGGGDREPPPDRPPPGNGGGPDRGRWLLSVRHQSGSLDALVASTRLKNIAVTTAVLALMLMTIAALVRFTRRAQALSALQMQFVASVSHELRTPLTVIRTAAHNISTGVVKTGDPNQLQRYGRLIGGQTEKLTALVEQVLGFANSESGRAVYKRDPVEVESLIQHALADCASVLAESRCTVESSIAPGTMALWGDATALRHALQNLITNAAKYGADGQWIGVTASMAKGKKDQPMVEIRVADRGAGIPAEECTQIFEPFFRGRRAIDDQVHGTGLGLALVKRIVEAHGGTIGVGSGPDNRGTEFTLQIPPAPPEQVDEFADITN